MSQGNDFANYASSVEDRGSASEDVWFVAVSSDDIKQMSVDQLDEAFRLGVITAQTAVWTEGMQAWAPLGEVADLDSDDGAAEPAAAEPEAFIAPAPSDPVAGSADSLPSARRTNPGWHNPFEPLSEAPAVQGSSLDALQSNSISMGPSSFAPVTASYAPGGALGHSTGPVALNVDEDMPPIHRGRRFRPERWLLAAAGVAAVAIVAFNNKDLFSSASSRVAAAEKQSAAAALVARPYDVGGEKASEAKAESGEKSEPAAARSADDGKEAPIGSLKGEAAEEDASDELAAAAKPSSSSPKEIASKEKEPLSKEALRGGFAKALNKDAPAAKPAKAAKAARAAKSAKLSRKAPPRAARKAKKPVARAASAFDPLNDSLP